MAAFDTCIDNVFEWYTGEQTATVTFSQKKWVTKLKKYAQNNSDISIVAENDDGSVVAHVPVNYFKFSPPRKGRELTDEEKAAAAARLANAREKKNGKAT